MSGKWKVTKLIVMTFLCFFARDACGIQYQAHRYNTFATKTSNLDIWRFADIRYINSGYQFKDGLRPLRGQKGDNGLDIFVAGLSRSIGAMIVNDLEKATQQSFTDPFTHIIKIYESLPSAKISLIKENYPISFEERRRIEITMGKLRQLLKVCEALNIAGGSFPQLHERTALESQLHEINITAHTNNRSAVIRNYLERIHHVQ